MKCNPVQAVVNRMRLVGAAVLLLAGTGIAPVALAQDPVPPGYAAAIIDRHIAARGGKTAILKITSRVLKMRIVHVGMDFEDEVIDYRDAKGRSYACIDSPAMGKIEHGFDGKIFWRLAEDCEPMVRKQPPDGGFDVADGLHGLVGWRKRFSRVDYQGTEKVNDRPCHRVVAIPKKGRPVTFFFDTETHLLSRVNTTLVSACGPPSPRRRTVSDYRWAGDVRVPHRVHDTFTMCGSKREMILQVTRVEHNVELPADRFTPPPAIQAALAKGAADIPCCGDRNAPGCGKPTEKPAKPDPGSGKRP